VVTAALRSLGSVTFTAFTTFAGFVPDVAVAFAFAFVAFVFFAAESTAFIGFLFFYCFAGSCAG
jgi:hypothetical protein